MTQPKQGQSPLTKVFLSEGGLRLRAGWRLVFQTIILLTLLGCLGIPLVLLILVVNSSLINTLPQVNSTVLLIEVVIEFFAITTSVFLAVRFLDKRPFENLGLKWNLQALVDILTGIGFSFIQMGFIYLVMYKFGWLTFEGFAWDSDSISVVILSALLFLVTFIFGGWDEELLLRGYHLQTLTSGLNVFWGVILSSAVFGLLHLRNPNASLISAVGIFFAGIYLAYAYLRTRQLWLSIGLHIGWNVFEGVVFGFPVSGLNTYTLLRTQVQGPEIWTGGAFGPEAGLIVLPSLLLGAFLIYIYTRQRLS